MATLTVSKAEEAKHWDSLATREQIIFQEE